jgi:hypothetical protein
VRPWPELDAKYQLSNGGGTEPIWAADGKKLFYRRRDEVVEIVPLDVQRRVVLLVLLGDGCLRQQGVRKRARRGGAVSVIQPL